MTLTTPHQAISGTAQYKIIPLLSREEIAQKVASLGREISGDYKGKNPLLLGVLKGSFIFMADLVRQIDIELSVDFIQAQSYGSFTTSGDVVLRPCFHESWRGRHVLVVEDIVDTGATVNQIISQVDMEALASFKVCSLLDKPSRRETPVTIDYLGFTVPDRFVVGYGLDYQQKHRNLQGIYVLEED